MTNGVISIVLLLMLLVAASTASYLFSRFNANRNQTVNQTVLAWSAVAIGATCLLGAGTLIVLFGSYLSVLPWSASREEPVPMIAPAKSSARTTRHMPAEQQAFSESEPTGLNSAGMAATAKPRTRSEAINTTGAEPRSPAHAPLDAIRRSDSQRSVERKSTGITFDVADPWAATQCVVPMRLDPLEPTRWTIENDCRATVAIVIATCGQSGRCDAWKYQPDGVVLPLKALRSVAEAEQTFLAGQLEHVACVIATPSAIRLIAQSSEIRATDEWRRQFEAARADDECLTRVQDLSTLGRQTGKPLDALVDRSHRFTTNETLARRE